MPLNSRQGRAGLQLVLVLAALGALIVIRNRGSQTIRDVTGYSLYAFAVFYVSYHSFKTIRLQLQLSPPPKELVLLARTKSPFWLYCGVIGVGIGFILNAIVMVNLLLNMQQMAINIESALRGDSTTHFLLGLSFCFSATGFLFTWLGANQVRITAHLLESWSLFGGYKSIQLEEVKTARIMSKWSPSSPRSRLEISSTRTDNKAPIVLALRLFQQADVDEILRWLGPKVVRHG
jgi:hypothetical protein